MFYGLLLIITLRHYNIKRYFSISSIFFVSASLLSV